MIKPHFPLVLLAALCVAVLTAPAGRAQTTPNIARGEGFGGPLTDAAKLTDGVIDRKAFAVVASTGTDPQLELMLTLRGPAYVERAVLYADAGIKKCALEFKTSLDIFTWEPTAKPVFTDAKDGLVKCEVTFAPRMVQYVALVLDTGRAAAGLKLMEFELSSREVLDIKFSNIRVENITETGADICWQTDIATTSKIKYNNRPEKLDKMINEINLTKEHRLALSSLLKGTDYYYQIYVDDIRIKPFNAPDQAFRTLGIPLPLFTGYSFTAEQDRAVIGWQTNVGTRAVLEFGDSAALRVKYPLKDTVAAERSVEVAGLFPATCYQFRVLCIDTFKNGIQSEAKHFFTKEQSVAQGKPVEGTFTQRPDRYITENPPILQRVNDGSTNYFTGMATSGDIMRQEQWVQIDLGQPYEVDNVWVMWRTNALSRDFALFASADSQAWTALAEHIDAMQVGTRASSESGDPAHVTVTPAGGKKFRYLKLTIPQGSSFYNKHVGRQNFVQIMELKVFPVLRKEFKPVVREIRSPKKK